MRALSLSILILAGCSKGDASKGEMPNAQIAKVDNTEGDAKEPAAKVKTWRARITGVYVGCKPSQDAARQALAKFPGVSDISFDPKAKTILLRVTEDEIKQSFAGVDAAQGKVGPRRVLALAGLAVQDIKFLDEPPVPVITFNIMGVVIDDSAPRDGDTMSLFGVFAGSDESQQAIRAALAPRKVRFVGERPIKSIKIQGQDLDQEEIQAKLKQAGFHSSSSAE
jgi:hypothetical protein